ncbi:MAG: alpha/beta hydrolase [Acidobacteria bacterium]|nr:alpha/beta hydrolase [Acidobacteriota bacterium]
MVIKPQRAAGVDTMVTIKQRYAYAGQRRIHYRRAGQGAPLVLLHASPGSSFSLQWLIKRLADQRTVIAIDTPGYGESTGLGLEKPEIADYAAALAESLNVLKLDRIDLYGSHTGAKIALEFAVRHPARVRRLVLDGVALFTPEERAEVLEHYTPSLTPQWDGSHLVRAWAMRRDMHIFWPWYRRSAEARLVADMPSPEALHGMVVDFLRAGANYWQGYHAAFRYEVPGALRRLGVPTLLLAAASDPLHSHLDRVDDLPANVKVMALDVSASEQEVVAERVQDFLAGEPLPNAPAPPPVPSAPGVVYRDYVDTSVGQLLMRRSGNSAGRPLLLLHAIPVSSASVESLLLAMGTDRPVITFDIPGTGDSAPVPGVPEVWDLAQVLTEATEALGLEDCDVYGTAAGALIALELALARPRQVCHLILDGPPLISTAEAQELLANFAPPMRMSWDGGHLIWAWNFLRDLVLWWPSHNRTAKNALVKATPPSPEAHHARLVDFVKGGTTYHLNYRAVFGYPMRTRLPMVTTPMLVCATSANRFFRAVHSEIPGLVPHAHVRAIGGTAGVELYRRFLADQPLLEESSV